MSFNCYHVSFSTFQLHFNVPVVSSLGFDLTVPFNTVLELFCFLMLIEGGSYSVVVLIQVKTVSVVTLMLSELFFGLAEFNMRLALHIIGVSGMHIYFLLCCEWSLIYCCTKITIFTSILYIVYDILFCGKKESAWEFPLSACLGPEG